MKTNQMTVAQAVFTAKQADKLFDQAARAWSRGSGSGSNDKMKAANAKCQKLRDQAEALLAPLGIEVDYPGLYPSFKVKGFTEYSTINAISAALEDKPARKQNNSPT